MTRAKRTALIAAINHKLRARGSWCGETHIQKAMYFLQEVAGVKTSFDFILYKHGPFSFELRDALGEMRADRMIVMQQQPYPYGPSLVVPPEQQKLLQQRFPHTLRRYSDRIEFVASHLGAKRVSDLERLATALYVKRQHPDLSTSSRAMNVTHLKPHISFDEAVEAVQEVDLIDAQASELIRPRTH